MNINKQHELPEDQYVRMKSSKHAIVLHFTAGGSAMGAIQHWKATNERVATAYVVDRDGSIYQAFDPMYWAYHLGGKTNTVTQASTIGIEIVNWGPLTVKDGKYYSGTRKVIPPEEVMEVAKPFRGFIAFQTFTEPQYGAVKALIEDLCTTFAIPEVYPQNPDAVLANVNRFNPGIYSHQNFRSDKCDIGPAWDWRKLQPTYSFTIK